MIMLFYDYGTTLWNTFPLALAALDPFPFGAPPPGDFFPPLPPVGVTDLLYFSIFAMIRAWSSSRCRSK